MGVAEELVDGRVWGGGEGSGRPAGEAYRGERKSLCWEGVRAVAGVIRFRFVRMETGGVSCGAFIRFAQGVYIRAIPFRVWSHVS